MSGTGRHPSLTGTGGWPATGGHAGGPLSAKARIAIYILGFAGLLFTGLELFLIHPVLDRTDGTLSLRYLLLKTPPAGSTVEPEIVPASRYLGLVAVFLGCTAACWFATWRAGFLKWTGRVAASIPAALFLWAWTQFTLESGLMGR